MALKKIVFFSILFASVVIINSLLHSIYSLWQKQDLIVKANQNLEKEKKDNNILKNQLAEVKKSDFVEEEARNKLFLAKPGEGVIMLPQDALSASHASRQVHYDTRPNWLKWWELFF